jgi:predicted GIY-YIG superfamily endonuclease
MAWVYILRCADGSYYVGSTLDMERRLWQHNEGIGAAYTKWRRPVTVAWAAEYHNVAEAYALEKKIQNWSRAKREALIEGRFDDLPLLSRGRTGWMKRGEGGGLD